jgi:predicted outer membrane repeat protein
MKSKQKKHLISLLVVITLLVTGQGVQAMPGGHTFTVNSNTDSGDSNKGNCICSTATGTCTLRAAVEEANACAGDDTILLQSGVTYPIGSTLTIDSPGSERIDIYPGGTQRAIISTETRPTAFSVVKGMLRLTSIHLQYSGGITVSPNGQLEVHDSEFRNNNGNHGSGVYAGGGAIYNLGELAVTFSTFISNTTEGRGGAIASFGKQAAIVNSLFLSNSAQVEGGAIYNSSISSYPDIYTFFSLQQSEVTSNTAPSGGGLALAGSNDSAHGTQVLISNSIIKGNNATLGGGINLLGNTWSGDYGGAADIYESEISGNTATHGAGIYSSNINYFMQFHSHLRNTTLSENAAAGNGGGIYVNGRAQFALYNVTLTNNRADSDSTGGGQGGGVYLNDPNPRFEMDNSILAGNKDLTSGPLALVAYDCYGTVKSLGYNLLGIMQAGVCTISGQTANVRSGTTSNPLDPGLEPLSATYKGVGAMTAFHALKLSSPALNGGNPGGCFYLTTTPIISDQRGELRPRGGRCDLGAFESDITPRKVFIPRLTRN